MWLYRRSVPLFEVLFPTLGARGFWCAVSGFVDTSSAFGLRPTGSSSYARKKLCGDDSENVTEKVKSRGLKLNRAYSISFDSSIVGKFFWSLILKDCIKGPEKKRKVVFLCSRARQIVKLGTYMFVVVQRRLSNVQKRVVNVQSCYLPKKTYCFFAVLVAVAVVDA